MFSPDGQSLVFTTGGAIKRIAIGGGTATTICQLNATPSTLTWANDGILFSDGRTAIMWVSQNGGKPLVLVDLKNSEDLAYAPQLLPDGDALLFTIVKRASAALGRWDASQVVVQSLKTGVRKPLIEGGSDAQYVPTGHIAYMSEGTLFAVPFDLRKLAVTGGAVPVVDSVRLANAFGFGLTGHFAFSNSGSLVYVPAYPSGGQDDVILFDRKGGAEPLKLPPGKYEFPRVSPDGTRLVLGTTNGKEAAVSIYELSGASTLRRLTFEGNNRFPIWSADGKRVAFQSDREGDFAVFWQSADGGPAERLTKPEPGTLHVPESWSPDGDVLLFSATKDFVSSLWTFSLRDRKATPFSDVKNLSLPPDAMFSPDGRWVAYQMGEAGAIEGSTLRPAVPSNGDEISGRAGWAAVVVPRRQRTLFCADARASHGRNRGGDGVDVHGHESGPGASRIRRSQSSDCSHIRRHARRPDRRHRDVGPRPEPKWIRHGADSRRGELVRRAQAPRPGGKMRLQI